MVKLHYGPTADRHISSVGLWQRHMNISCRPAVRHIPKGGFKTPILIKHAYLWHTTEEHNRGTQHTTEEHNTQHTETHTHKHTKTHAHTHRNTHAHTQRHTHTHTE